MLFIVNARCVTCGYQLSIQEPDATGDAFLDVTTGRLSAVCKNLRECRARRAARDMPPPKVS